jgi:hypothetical protein
MIRIIVRKGIEKREKSYINHTGLSSLISFGDLGG